MGNVYVSNFFLSSRPIFQKSELDLADVIIEECLSRAIVSIGISAGEENKLAKTINSSFNIDLPVVGYSTVSDIKNVRLLGLQKDQYFLIFDYFEFDPLVELSKDLKNYAYLTDQTDSWAMLTLSGDSARVILQQACPVDLHPTKFKKDAVCRTIIEHLSVIILCESMNRFLILSPRSTAKSFLEFIKKSLKSFDPIL